MKKITIYTKTNCPYCIKAKDLLVAKGLAFDEVLFTDNDTAELAKLVQKTNQRTVPQIFIEEQFIGGCDDLHALEASGELDRMLRG